MEKDAPAAVLVGMTSTLEPAHGVAKEQLERLKAELSEVVAQQELETMTAAGSPGLDALNRQQGLVDTGLVRAFDERLSPSSASARKALANELRVFRRELPVRTSQHPASVPTWAAGRQVDHTLGPFVDRSGRWFWFDFFKQLRSVTVARGTDLFLRIPVQGFLVAKNEYELGAGSIWLRSRLLSPSAPAGAFTGLKIKSGRISFSGAVSVSGTTLVLGAADDCELVLTLDQPIPRVASDTTTGNDAKDLSLALPAAATLLFRPGGAVVRSASKVDQQLYGVRYRYHSVAGPVHFEPLLNRLLVPYQADATQFAARTRRSDLLRTAGSADVLGSYWALPVTISSIDQLGDAAGVGALAMRVSTGVKATWYGLHRGRLRLQECFVLTEPGRIAISAGHAASERARQSLELWNETDTAKPVRVRVELTYLPSFLLLYNCSSDGAESIVVQSVALEAHLDRPLTAAGARPAIRAPAATAFLIQIKAERSLFLAATGIQQQLAAAQQRPDVQRQAFALSNAFIRTASIEDFYMVGQWSEEGSISQGLVVLDYPISSLMPTLPDPYVTNYQPVRSEGRAAFARGASGFSLAALVRWPKPANPGLRLLLLTNASAASALDVLVDNSARATGLPASPESRASGSVASPVAYSYVSAIRSSRHNRIEEVQQEDSRNAVALRAIFDRALNSNGEQIFLLDVSTNADLFGVALRLGYRRPEAHVETTLPFSIDGMDLVTPAFNTRIYTLPQIQWEPVRTLQNPNVRPFPFASPATSANTGDPTLIGTESYTLVPIAPLPVVDTLVSEYAGRAERLAALFSLPFGMKAAAVLDNPDDAAKPGATLDYNRPEFGESTLKGGLQLSLVATTPSSGADAESAHFAGATIQTRNLIELLTGSIPLDDDGKPLSVLGPVVDTIFNGEFRPGGNSPRVPLERLDVSGYGATIFSNWLNPNAQIAATSQAKFDVLIGRTSHEVIQVKSILYPWGVAVVRTITIQRTPGGGVTRHDSGWRAQGPGVYDFSYRDASAILHPNPFEFHPGIVRGMYQVTEIRDTGRTYRKAAATPTDDVIMQEVFFNADALLEDVVVGGEHNFVPSRKQRGFVQLSPYQKPLTSAQFYQLLLEEGPLGGPIDCVVDVGRSGQRLRAVRVQVSSVDDGANKLFVSAGQGSLQLPKEGGWSMVKRSNSSEEIASLDADDALPLIREGKLSTSSSTPYRFADPTDLKRSASPNSDYGLLHSMGSQKVLFLRPSVASHDPHLRSSISPFFADSYAILASTAIFPPLDTTFPLGSGGTDLRILGNGQLRLDSGGHFTAPGGITRDLLNSGDSRIYVDYSDASGGATSAVDYTFDSTAAVPWAVGVKAHSIVIDLLAFKSLITITSDFRSQAGEKPALSAPVLKFGPVLQPIVDLLSFLGGFDMAQAFRVSMGNAKTDSWQPKWKASLLGLKIEFPLLEIRAFGVHVGGASKVAQEAFEQATPLPPVKVGVEIEIEAHYNMLPFSFETDAPAATPTEIAKAEQDMLSVGASIKLGGEIHILCAALSPTLGLYFFGLLELEFGIDSHKGKSFKFKAAVGLELATKWPIVGEVAIAMGIGLEIESAHASSGTAVLMLFKGEAEILDGLIAIGISIEAKGGQEKETEDGVDKTFGICEVEFAAEVTLAFVIHFEFDVTWQEKKQLS